jgi:hypothetical protein
LTIEYTQEELYGFFYAEKELPIFDAVDVKTAYLVFMFHLMLEQKKSIDLVLGDSLVDEIIVEGGFANNALFIQLLKLNYPEIIITASHLAQGSALGAALLIIDEIWRG